MVGSGGRATLSVGEGFNVPRDATDHIRVYLMISFESTIKYKVQLRCVVPLFEDPNL